MSYVRNQFYEYCIKNADLVNSFESMHYGILLIIIWIISTDKLIPYSYDDVIYVHENSFALKIVIRLQLHNYNHY